MVQRGLMILPFPRWALYPEGIMRYFPDETGHIRISQFAEKKIFSDATTPDRMCNRLEILPIKPVVQTYVRGEHMNENVDLAAEGP